MSDRSNNILDCIEHSATQEKRAEYQVSSIFHNSNILPDSASKTKREVMDENRENGAKTSHDVHNGTPISWDSYHTYKSACTALGVYVRQEFGVKDLHDITPPMVQSFLRFEVDCEIKYSTFDKNCSGINKFCECINEQNGYKQDFHSVITEMRVSAKEELPLADYTTRAYDNPTAIIGELSGNAQIAAELQYSCGLRISDACYIKSNQFDGQNLTVHSKNGQYLTVQVNSALADKIGAEIKENGSFAISRDAYTYRLEKACTAVGEEFHGSHGLRHNFAQEKMAEYTSGGMSFNKALHAVSENMGHHRPDITKVYLR